MTDRTCSIDGCDQPVKVRGWCKTHYDRWWRSGDVQATEPLKPRNNSERFAWIEAVCAETPDGQCRDWPWGRDNNSEKGGYPVVYRGVLRLRVTAVVLEATVGPRPKGMYALHSCDRKVCAAPWHLRWGTPSENNRESWERIRGPRLRGEIT